MTGFDPSQFGPALAAGHGGRLGVMYHAHAPGWVELALPYAPDLVGDPDSGVVASGPIVALMDMAAAMAIWSKRGGYAPQVTLDLRVDHLRSPIPGRTVIGRGECHHLARSVAFVRGQAHDGDPADPIAHVVGTFMLLDAGA